MSTVIVAGALANKPHNGGGAWERLSWVTGLRRLGCEVYFVEEIAADVCVDDRGAVVPLADSVNLAWFRSVMDWFGLTGRAALLDNRGEDSVVMSMPQVWEVLAAADLLVNLSGHLTLEPLLAAVRRKVYVDVDPGYTQIWHADQATPFRVTGHDEYFTIGENI